MHNSKKLVPVLLFAALSAWASVGINLRGSGVNFDRSAFRLGLDLQGGTHLVLQADLARVPEGERADAMRGVLQVIERRVNAYGVSEPVIQIQGIDRVIVELPGIKDIEEGKRLIGKTAQLKFLERNPAGEWVPATGTLNDGTVRELTGKYLLPGKQQVIFSQANQPQVTIQFEDDGAALWTQITRRNLKREVAITLDDQIISDPVVQDVLSHNSVITGLRLDEARLLAIQLNAGALPVPVSIEQERTVDASLGADSIQKSLVAGLVAMGVVAVFMVSYYRLPGVLATGALAIYATTVLGIFKLLPVTLTLAGFAAFILSVGMAVDANILIFERMREELRAGKTLGVAVDLGFRRAWPSIRDSNVSTFITCTILYYFGSTFGATLIMGFALTLFIGVAVSMLTAILVTWTFLGAIVGTPVGRRPWLFGVRLRSLGQPTAGGQTVRA